ncbi:phage virion morphogenesis protein [Candidatus Tokpelaia sp.]|uniref:phage virion morphogenesis protein n=1 Tax=Candidatus Tokpelaia sp. TaxID=2233777 RepID=UPI00123B62D2|nr:phage virion morphogenesis protein [Candidatus Tokpelaia sp.]KAA6404511.1 phage virion morphogenesis protein [Candidatus Tokpelaia sp.]
MAGVSIKVNVDDKRLLADFQRLQRALGDTTPIMRIIGVGLTGNIQKRLKTGVLESRWAPLNPAYRAQKRNARMMVESGMLRSSLTSAPGNGYVYIGTNRVYAAIHQLGGTIKKQHSWHDLRDDRTYTSQSVTTMPARPFLTVEEDDREMMANIIFTRLQRLLSSS